MSLRLFFTLIVLGMSCNLSGCVKNIATNNNPELGRKKQVLLAQGYSEAYSNAYIEGCKLGNSASGAQCIGSMTEAEAWQAGYDTCREQFLEELQRKNHNADDKDKKSSKDNGFTERQQKIWEQLRK